MILALPVGNRCGHDPRTYRPYLPPQEHKDRPWAIRNVIQILKDFQGLAFFLSLFRRLNPKGRKKRSEREEALLAILQAMMHYFDPKSFQVGVQSDSGGFNSISLIKLAKDARLSLERAKSAIRDLQSMGFVTVKRQSHKKVEGKYGSKPSIRAITKEFFLALGVKLKAIYELRDKKLKESEVKFSKIIPKKFGETLTKKLKREKTNTQEIERKKRLVDESLSLKTNGDTRTLTAIYLELMKQLK